MTSADREQLKRTFDRDAELYDQARPGYPEQIFDDLLAFACLGPEAIVLEVGCGAGQASQALAQRAYRLVCLARQPIGYRCPPQTRAVPSGRSGHVCLRILGPTRAGIRHGICRIIVALVESGGTVRESGAPA